MNLRSVWRKSGALVLGAALVGSAFFGAISVSAQAPTLPTLVIVTGVTNAAGAAVTSGTVSAWVGATKCSEAAIASGGTALTVGQTSQPAACTSAAVGSAVGFQVDGASATATPAVTINPGVPQNVALKVGGAAPSTPGAGATGNGGYLGGGSNGLFGIALGVIALATVGGSLAVRRIRRSIAIVFPMKNRNGPSTRGAVPVLSAGKVERRPFHKLIVSLSNP